MKSKIFFVLGMVLTSVCWGNHEDSKQRDRLEELFIWKVTDSLDLDPKTEAKVAEILKALGEGRHACVHQMKDAIEGMEKAGPDEKRKFLSIYEAGLRKCSEVQVKEFALLRPVLKDANMAKYLAVKDQFADKLKTILSRSQSTGADSFQKEPTIIENK